MQLTITVRMQADSKEELINVFPSNVAIVRKHFDKQLADGLFGPPENVKMRYLVIGGGWAPPAVIQESDVQEHGTPETE